MSKIIIGLALAFLFAGAFFVGGCSAPLCIVNCNNTKYELSK